jgi:hypothetical protein
MPVERMLGEASQGRDRGAAVGTGVVEDMLAMNGATDAEHGLVAPM